MRISREQFAQNRDHLLNVALTQFRIHGFDGVGVADLMTASGMSLGSFYGYFDSKEQLIAEASARAVTGTTALISSYLATGESAAVSRLAKGYLSPEHKDNLAGGCALAALGSEMTHQSETVRECVTEQLQELFSSTEQYLHGSTTSERGDNAIALTASLIGGLILSRATSDKKLSDRILKAVRKSIKQSNQPSDTA